MDSQQIGKSDWVLVNFLDFEKSLNGGSKLPIHAKRKAAFSEFSKSGFPTPQIEEWKYTNVAEIREGAFTLAVKPNESVLGKVNLKPVEIPGLDAFRIVIVDGHFIPSLSALEGLPSGVIVQSIMDAQKGVASDALNAHLAQYASTTEHFVGLNTAFINDGVFVSIPKKAILEKPIHIIAYATSEATQKLINQRVLVIAEESSEATIVESYYGVDTQYFTNSVVECVVRENAKLNHYRVQEEAKQSFHISTIQGHLQGNAVFKTHTFSFGGKLVRNHVNAVIDGSGSNVTMNGLSVLNGDQHVDNATLLDHAKPHCESHELYKGVYSGRSQGVFGGTIIVREDAQKTNAIQSNRSLLLSNEASVNTKPQLKIWADDVKCTHGATIGQLDADALFYIRSRGVGEKDAQDMLVHAFASEVISCVEEEPLRQHLETLLNAKLAA